MKKISTKTIKHSDLKYSLYIDEWTAVRTHQPYVDVVHFLIKNPDKRLKLKLVGLVYMTKQ